MSKRHLFRNFLIAVPFMGFAVIFAISKYSGCHFQDAPFAYLGDQCVKNGIYWNKIAAPIGNLSIFWAILGPGIWILFVVTETAIGFIKEFKN